MQEVLTRMDVAGRARLATVARGCRAGTCTSMLEPPLPLHRSHILRGMLVSPRLTHERLLLFLVR